jgi:hypothetical protein
LFYFILHLKQSFEKEELRFNKLVSKVKRTQRDFRFLIYFQVNLSVFFTKFNMQNTKTNTYAIEIKIHLKGPSGHLDWSESGILGEALVRSLTAVHTF